MPSAAQISTEAFPNPVIKWNFADPFLLATKDRYYAYATNSGGVNVQVSFSVDLRQWSTPPREAMPVKPNWIRDDWPNIWAPEVIRVRNRYIMFFSGAAERARRPDPSDPSRQCIGVAVSRWPDRDFVAVNHPLICAEFEEGVIDASPFRDDGKLYLYFKSDGNCCNRDTEIFVQELAATGLDFIGDPVSLRLKADRSWEGAVIEAPTMIKQGDRYLLFYSANHFGDGRYAVGYAECSGAMGPCRDKGDGPVLASTPGSQPPLIGPGHQSILQREGRTYVAFHAWKAAADGRQEGCRAMHIEEIRWSSDGAPVIVPTFGPISDWACPP